ncbi:DNA adenine methylase [Dehalobacter sp. TeCB1]|uniref:DNA adenine methylase n=1 Tax=Dehalobacter sp. TeCB1 TaxID=1843715 RepID=UPI00083B79C9|nr:DNA adenine methylase [Dehalobacter sp. TeCB1]OCZ53781.1 DNA methylase [Dehalobacter sp. TeCB1]
MNSFIARIGGKRLLRKAIVARFPEDFERYIEVFGGAGWVLFYKEKHADLEVYNDADGDLVNLFRCVKYHCDEFLKELSYCLNSRELFEDFVSQKEIRGLTDIQRAARYFLLIKTSYGADGRTFGCAKRNIASTMNYLTQIKERLDKVVIEHKDFENLINVYDRPEALFYADPPYYGSEKYYKETFTDIDHERLRDCLSNINGRCIISYNDHEYIRQLYKDFKIEEIDRQNNLVNKYHNVNKKYRELLIMNY